VALVVLVLVVVKLHSSIDDVKLDNSKCYVRSDMPKCSFKDSCPIPNDKLPTSPQVIDIMVDNFCNDRFTKCSVYKAAIDDVETSNGGACLSGESMKRFISGRM